MTEPRSDVGYLMLISRSGTPSMLRVPVGERARQYSAKWSAIVKAARAVLTEQGRTSDDFLMLDNVSAPWDWDKPWAGKLLMADLRERALQCDAAFAGEPAWPRHHLYDWTGNAFTRVREPLEVPEP